jgi:hypothetical protein
MYVTWTIPPSYSLSSPHTRSHPPLFAFQQRGVISWDLPSRVVYRPGETLRFTLTVQNPTTATQNYVLNARVFRGGQLVWAQDLLVDGQRIFSVPARSQVQMHGSFSSDSTDIVLMIALMDPQGTELSSVRAELVSAASAIDLTPLMGVLAIALVAGMVLSVSSAIRKEG